MDGNNLPEYLTNAIKFWERGRILYNIVLALIVVVHFIADYPAAKAGLSLNFALGLFLLAIVANIAYCAAYLVDIFAQYSGFRDVWRRYRWVLLAIGIIFAAVITHFVSSGMFLSGSELN